MKISYELKKKSHKEMIKVTVNILRGELNQSENNKRIVFSGEQVFEAKVDELTLSRGARGLYSLPLTIKVHEWNNLKCK